MKIISVHTEFSSYTIPCTADGYGRGGLPLVAFTFKDRTWTAEVSPSGRLFTSPALRQALGFCGRSDDLAVLR